MTKAVTRNWHQYRTVTKNLPLRNTYDPLFNGTSSICYLVDSGVNIDHAIFTESKFEQVFSFDGNFSDTHGHGTAIASLINSGELGIAPGALIKIVDIAGDSGSNIDQQRVIDALDAVLQDHLATKEETKVVCLPWIVKRDAVIDQKVVELTENNLVVVCAAGQTGMDTDMYSPAGLDETVTVGAVDYYDRAYDVDHPWTKSHVASNHGQSVNMFAPGSEITTADINGFVTTAAGPSTSASSAIVAGLCLNIISSDSSLTATDVIASLYATAIADIVYFADESKYNAHHNRLAYQANTHYREIWGSRGQLAELTTCSGKHTVDLTVADDITSIDSESYAHIPAFMSIEGNCLTIDTDCDAEAGKYQFILSARKNDNKSNRSFYVDILDANGQLPAGKEYYTEVTDDGVFSTTNYLEFQGPQTQLK